jgi:hypothetical protein
MADENLVPAFKMGYATVRASGHYTMNCRPYNCALDKVGDPEVGWVAVHPATISSKEYLQFSFFRPQLVVGIATQGNPTMNQWVMTYKVFYHRNGGNDDRDWVPLKNSEEHQSFPGNSDVSTIVVQKLYQPVWASAVRVIPIECQGHTNMRCDVLIVRPGIFVLPAALPAIQPILSESFKMGYASVRSNTEHNPGHSAVNCYLHNTMSRVRAWVGKCCPATLVTKEYVQFSFFQPQLVVAIATQGRNNDTQWVTKYYAFFHCQQGEEKEWKNISTERNGHEMQVFEGNTDSDTVKECKLLQPVWATAVRVMPIQSATYTSMRCDVLINRLPPKNPPAIPPAIPDAQLVEAFKLGYAYIRSSGDRWEEKIDHYSENCYLDNTHNWAAVSKAWCGMNAAASVTTNEYLQFSFFKPQLVVAIATQGRQDAAEWVTQYRVLYHYEGRAEANWGYADSVLNGGNIFTGNSDQNTKVIRRLKNAVWATAVRINPVGSSGYTSMRCDVLIRRPEAEH